MNFSAAVIFLLTSLVLEMPIAVQGHGYMFIPTSRNRYAHTSGVSYNNGVKGIPPSEYCAHCLNANQGVCGISEQGIDYDAWLDVTGEAMPWISQQEYEEGQVIEVHSHLTANHAGHMMIRACAMGKESTQECFNNNRLEFVEDVAFGMPKDPAYPDRGYYHGGAGANGFDYVMRFQLPPGLAGEKVLLQWEYFTANSCSPVGYAAYFGGANSDNQALSDEHWNPGIPACAASYPDHFVSAAPPERFINCAEVTIIPSSGGIPTTSPPMPLPTPNPTFGPAPSDAPFAVLTSPPTKMPVIAPTKAPVSPFASPTQPPIPSPTAPAPTPSTGNGCCSHDFKNCATWGNESREICEQLGGMKWLVNGPLTDTCLVRYSDCTQSATKCCDGLVCQGSEFYKQCRNPGVDV
jgi:hypothetical protein